MTREVAQSIERQGFVERRIHRERARGDADRITVGRRLREHVEPDDGGGTCAIVDHDLLAEALAHFRREYARDHVRAAAWRVRYDQAHGATRKRLRACKVGGRRNKRCNATE